MSYNWLMFRTLCCLKLKLPHCFENWSSLRPSCKEERETPVLVVSLEKLVSLDLKTGTV